MARLIPSSTVACNFLGDHVVRRALASLVALFAVGPLAGCSSLSSGSPATTPDSSTTGQSNEDSGGNGPTPEDSSTGATQGSGDGGATPSDGGGVGETSSPVCPAPTPNSDTLPFAVDVMAKFITSGYEGDIAAISMPNDPTCGGNRSSATALGNCHPVNYVPPSAAATPKGWAGVVWQHPANNFGASPGYLIPPGATKVSFWAKGAVGGENVSFGAGLPSSGPPTAASPCQDTAAQSLPNQILTTTWTHYTIPLMGQTYGGGVIAGFSFTLAASDQPNALVDAGAPADGAAGTGDAGDAGDAGGPLTKFYIDDIEWQQ